ncbi:hypothetical protein V6N12_010525 [Hibiscus sabdariffa]|uniref:UBN2 domain-containing protein n=1 Tax=Hibiscus sabdariffa TaxID=183260 RepID=A0ABR2EKD9_9ROSI
MPSKYRYCPEYRYTGHGFETMDRGFKTSMHFQTPTTSFGYRYSNTSTDTLGSRIAEKDGPTIPSKRVGEILIPKERHEWSDQERKQVQLNAKALHILLCALGPDEFAKVSSCGNAKEIWNKLELALHVKPAPSHRDHWACVLAPARGTCAQPPQRDHWSCVPAPARGICGQPPLGGPLQPLYHLSHTRNMPWDLIHPQHTTLGPNEFAKVSSCGNAKEIWNKLEVIHEGTNEVKETKIGLLNLNYENFKMDPNEDIKAMFNRFSTIMNELKGFREAIPEDKLVWKLIYSLPESWDSKKTTIIEAKNLKELKLDELIGSLITHELMSKPLIREKEKKIKEQGINVNVIALKSSKKLQEDSREEESEEEDEEMQYLVKNFTRFMKYEKEKSRHESKKKKMKEPQRVQSSNKRGSSSKKAYVATWSDEEDSTEENEVAHLCFMALQEGEVTSNSSNLNSYTFDELQDAYDELVF